MGAISDEDGRTTATHDPAAGISGAHLALSRIVLGAPGSTAPVRRDPPSPDPVVGSRPPV